MSFNPGGGGGFNFGGPQASNNPFSFGSSQLSQPQAPAPAFGQSQPHAQFLQPQQSNNATFSPFGNNTNVSTQQQQGQQKIQPPQQPDQQQQANMSHPPGTGLFGSLAPPGQSQQPKGSGLFGSSAPPSSSNGQSVLPNLANAPQDKIDFRTPSPSFAQSQQNKSNTNGSFGGFGQQQPFAQSQQSNSASTNGNLFGGFGQKPSSPFAQSQQNTNTGTNGNSFGGFGQQSSTQNQSASNTGTGLSVFGSANQQQQAPSAGSGDLFSRSAFAPPNNAVDGNSAQQSDPQEKEDAPNQNVGKSLWDRVTPTDHAQDATSSNATASNQQSNLFSASTSGFGQPAKATEPTPTGSLFGATKPTTNTGGFNFGQPSSTTTESAPTSNLFGATKPTTTTGGFNFGQSSSTTTESAPTSNMFGATPFTGASGFGQPAKATESAPSSNLFGATKPTTTTSGFGQPQATSEAASTSNLFGAKPAAAKMSFDQPSTTEGTAPTGNLFSRSTFAHPNNAWPGNTPQNDKPNFSFSSTSQTQDFAEKPSQPPAATTAPPSETTRPKPSQPAATNAVVPAASTTIATPANLCEDFTPLRRFNEGFLAHLAKQSASNDLSPLMIFYMQQVARVKAGATPTFPNSMSVSGEQLSSSSATEPQLPKEAPTKGASDVPTPRASVADPATESQTAKTSTPKNLFTQTPAPRSENIFGAQVQQPPATALVSNKRSADEQPTKDDFTAATENTDKRNKTGRVGSFMTSPEAATDGDPAPSQKQAAPPQMTNMFGTPTPQPLAAAPMSNKRSADEQITRDQPADSLVNGKRQRSDTPEGSGFRPSSQPATTGSESSLGSSQLSKLNFQNAFAPAKKSPLAESMVADTNSAQDEAPRVLEATATAQGEAAQAQAEADRILNELKSVDYEEFGSKGVSKNEYSIALASFANMMCKRNPSERDLEARKRGLKTVMWDSIDTLKRARSSLEANVEQDELVEYDRKQEKKAARARNTLSKAQATLSRRASGAEREDEEEQDEDDEDKDDASEESKEEHEDNGNRRDRKAQSGEDETDFGVSPDRRFGSLPKAAKSSTSQASLAPKSVFAPGGFKIAGTASTTPGSFLSAFGDAAKKSEEAAKKARFENDYDSEEETPEQWEKRDAEEQAKLKASFTTGPSTGGFKPAASSSGDVKPSAPSSTGFKPTMPATTSSSFLGSFGAAAAKAEEAQKRKRMDEDYDSEEETREQWENRDAEEQAKKKQKFTSGTTGGFRPAQKEKDQHKTEQQKQSEPAATDNAAKGQQGLSKFGSTTPPGSPAKPTELPKAANNGMFAKPSGGMSAFGSSTGFGTSTFGGSSTSAGSPVKTGIFGSTPVPASIGGSTSGGSGSVFGAPASKEASAEKEATPAAAADDEDAAPAEPQQQDVTALLESERDGNTVLFHSSIAKASKLAPKTSGPGHAWVDVGKGPLWVLKNTATGRVRVLMKIPPMGRTVMNFAALAGPKDMYRCEGARGKGVKATFVDHLDAKAAGKPANFYIMCKEPADAESIAGHLQGGQPR